MKPESDCGNTREGGCARLESGAAFMPGVSEKRLEKAARREKDKCAKSRLLACLGRKKGHSIRRISRDLKTAYSAIRDWLLRMRDRGLKGRFNARPKGQRAGLPLQIIRTVRRWLKRSPKKCGFETGSWMALDNASYHKSKAVREYVESTGGDVELEFLPPYTPQLNPVETVWRDLKKRLAGRFFRSLDELKAAITAILGREMGNRLKGYLVA